jgi:transposase
VDWRGKVDLFEQLRREHEFGIGTIAGVATKFGVHRRVVRQALVNALPAKHHYPARAKPKLGALVAFIDEVLAADRQAPRKQRHTARRLYRRILTEFPDATVAESTVRNHVRERKRQMGLMRRETFVPQSYVWAQEAQVDWYEAWVDLGDERTRVQVFAMRSMASGAAFHRAYLHATQQAFLEAHEQAFAYFGGVFRLLRYDNLASAVRKILRGYRREETVRFMAFRSHWRFAAEFCTPGEGHEKGGIEGEGGYFRRNHLVPVPRVADLDALNTMLITACRADEARILDGRTDTIGAELAVGRATAGHADGRGLDTRPHRAAASWADETASSADRPKITDHLLLRASDTPAARCPATPAAMVDAAAPPSISDWCSCCRGQRWWSEVIAPRGWRCWQCHPPSHLDAETVREMRT